jgi:2-polyprenyl-3-methyl-5-hydroxy-6-metoxy-1,4-benzoquinol methylase
MNKDKLKIAVDQVYRDLAGAMAATLGFLGVKTGLFRAMAGAGPLTVAQVVERTGLQSRYVEEWLKAMVAARYLAYDPAAETFALSEEHAYLVAAPGTDHDAGALFGAVPGLVGAAGRVSRAFRDGGGVPFSEYGDEFVDALDAMNRGQYELRLTQQWLHSMPAVVQALQAGTAALDIGCGVGRVSIALAKAFPASRFVGVDLSESSIRKAQAAGQAAGLADRVAFIHGTLDALAPGQRFGLITACDCVHDFTAPLETLRGLKRRLTGDGTLFVVEPKVADRLEDNQTDIATLFFGFSVLHCMTQSLAGGGPGLGTCLGAAGMERLVREAGFTRFQVLPVKSLVNLFYAVGH